MRTSFAVNDMTIHRIVEQEAGFTPMLDFLPTLSKETLGENLAWLAPGGYDSASGNVVLCFQSYVVKTPHHNILVDSCIGNDKNFPLRPTWNKKTDGNWMGALKAAGLGVEDIDFVMCTHLHGATCFRKKNTPIGARSIARRRSTRSPTACCRSSRPTGPNWSAAIMRSTTISD
jgi:hypothetical protein